MCYRGTVCGSIPCECGEPTQANPPAQYQLETDVENARKMWDWVKNRGGVAVWLSQDLAEAGRKYLTPVLDERGERMLRPHWSTLNVPDDVVQDETKLGICTAKTVRTIRVGIKRGSGLSFTLTEAASRRLRVALDVAGEGSFYTFGFTDDDKRVAYIKVPSSKISLAEYAKQEGWQ